MGPAQKYVRAPHILLALSLGAVLLGALQLCQPVVAQPSPAPYDDSAQNATMTRFQVLNGGNGQQYYLTNNKQAIVLPGAGVNDNAVTVYTAPDGSQWYVDRTGTQQSLPPAQANPAYTNNNMASGPYGQSDWNTGSNYYAQQQYAAPPVAPSVQNNYYQNNEGSGSSGGGSGLATAATALASGIGAAAGAALSSVPWGTPVYWGGGSPWYYGAGGSATYVNRNFNSFNEWNHQNNYWNHSSSNHWNNNNFHNNNFDHHWGHDNWPGKDHGFPPPHDQIPGRMYSPNGGDRAGFGRGGGNGFGGGDRRGGGFGGGDRGGFGGGDRGGMGGRDRGGMGGGDRRGGGGEHRGGGGDHRGGGGGHHGGGGGHHGGGGHGRR